MTARCAQAESGVDWIAVRESAAEFPMRTRFPYSHRSRVRAVGAIRSLLGSAPHAARRRGRVLLSRCLIAARRLGAHDATETRRRVPRLALDLNRSWLHARLNGMAPLAWKPRRLKPCVSAQRCAPGNTTTPARDPQPRHETFAGQRPRSRERRQARQERETKQVSRRLGDRACARAAPTAMNPRTF